MKRIKVKLNGRSIGNAIKEIEAYRNNLRRIRTEMCERLAEIGMKEASVRFANAQYDGVNDAKVDIEQTESGYKVVAAGNAVAFIEFGTGVHYNSDSTYPITKPSGSVGIGEYGKGKGKTDKWTQKGEPGTNGIVSGDGKVVTTHGNSAQMPMYHALTAMQSEVERVVREAFKDA